MATGNRATGIDACGKLSDKKIIQNASEWVSMFEKDELIPFNYVWYFFKKVAMEFNARGIYSGPVNCSTPEEDKPSNYSDYKVWVDNAGNSDGLNLNPKGYWIEAKSAGYSADYVAVLFDRFNKKLDQLDNGGSSDEGQSNNFLTTERSFLVEQGLINLREDEYLKNYAGNNIQMTNTDSIREIFNRLAKALGSGTDTYNSNMYFFQAKGILQSPDYWCEPQENNDGEFWDGGAMLQQGWADGSYVATVIKNYVNRYKIDILRYQTDKNGAVIEPSKEQLDKQVIVNIKELHKDLGIYVPTLQEEKEFTYFNRWKTAEYIDTSTNGRAYIFITKPRCNFTYENIKTQRYYANLAATIKGKNILTNLTYGTSDTDPIPNSPRGLQRILTNKATNFDCQDVTLEQDNTVSTVKNYKYSLPGSEAQSVTNGSFTITYEEDNHLSITLLHKAWVDYITNVRYGYFKPSELAMKQRYIDYVASLYYFLVGEDGQTIKYFAKYTGIYPTNIPYSSMSWSKGSNDIIKVPIQYSFSFKEDMEPTIIKEFNTIFGNINTNPNTIRDDFDEYVNKGNLDSNPKGTWKNSVGIYRVFPKGDGTFHKRWIDEDGNSKFYFDNTAKLLFFDK